MKSDHRVVEVWFDDRDVRLAGDLWLPGQSDPFPTVVMVTQHPEQTQIIRDTIVGNNSERRGGIFGSGLVSVSNGTCHQSVELHIASVTCEQGERNGFYRISVLELSSLSTAVVVDSSEIVKAIRVEQLFVNESRLDGTQKNVYSTNSC